MMLRPDNWSFRKGEMMKFRTGLILAIFMSIAAAGFAVGCGSSSASQSETAAAGPETSATPASVPTANDAVFDGQRIERTKAEWKKQLTPAQYYILREEGTDQPYKSQFHDSKAKGDYHCAACNLKVFSSETKFDSGTGWPSFYQPVNALNVVEKEDKSLGETRIEVECARCGSHLGHVFDDGPKPTGLRYCINGTSLKFVK